MKAHEKSTLLGNRRNAAIENALTIENEAHKAYEAAKRARLSTRFLLGWMISRAKELRTRKAYELAQIQRLTITRQYNGLLEAVVVDYYEANA